jgi:hypothetical protein
LISTHIGIVYLTQGSKSLILLLNGFAISFLRFLLGPSYDPAREQPLDGLLSR